MSTNIDQAINKTKRILSDAVSRARDNNRKAAVRALNATMIDMTEKFKPEFRKKIDEFYDSYSPLYYDRRGQMGNILQIEKAESGEDFIHIVIDYDADYIQTRTGGDALLDSVFGEGYHGGAYGTDRHGSTVSTRHYRKPYLPNDPKKSWRFWSYEAVRTESPYENWLKWLHEYASGGELQKVFDTHYQNEKSKMPKILG
jgi:hypothetical protein